MRVLHIAEREASDSRKRVVLGAMCLRGPFGCTVRAQASPGGMVRRVQDMTRRHAMSLAPAQVLRRRTADHGHAVFQRQYAPRTFGLRFTDLLNEVIGKRAAPR